MIEVSVAYQVAVDLREIWEFLDAQDSLEDQGQMGHPEFKVRKGSRVALG